MSSTEKKLFRSYDRMMLRSSYVSLIFSAFQAVKRRRRGFTMSALAESIGKDKATLSRDLSGSPNWRLDTISALAEELDLQIYVCAVDRETGEIFGSVPETTSQRFETEYKQVAVPTWNDESNKVLPLEVVPA